MTTKRQTPLVYLTLLARFVKTVQALHVSLYLKVLCQQTSNEPGRLAIEELRLNMNDTVGKTTKQLARTVLI